jgi:exodeoxyribonuclease-5
MKFQLSDDQKNAVEALTTWHKSNNGRYLTLGGYAGTGKTTLIAYFRKLLFKDNKKLRVAFCSFTGKAARVLEVKLREAKAVYPKDSVSTIHSLIYSPITNDNEEIIGWELKDELDTDLIIVDEASMIDQNIWKDLSFFGIPILAVGDHGQLPPIKGSFNLMQDPKLRLDKIHRQAAGNPIIKLSERARKEGEVPYGKFGEGVIKYDKQKQENKDYMEDLMMGYDENTMVLCGYNNTRVRLNSYIRQLQGFRTERPESGDRVICLRNNHEANIYNGMIGTLSYIEEDNEDWYYAEISMDGEDFDFKGLISRDQFNHEKTLSYTELRKKTGEGDLFDFGYALTVHKAQGSQAQRVVLFEQRFKRMDDDNWRRWLYTGVTRAESELYIFG